MYIVQYIFRNQLVKLKVEFPGLGSMVWWRRMLDSILAGLKKFSEPPPEEDEKPTEEEIQVIK